MTGRWYVTMRRIDPWLLSLVAVTAVAFLLGVCLTALADIASPTHPVCTAVKGEEVGPSKVTSPTLWALPVETTVPPRGLSLSECTPLERSPGLVSAELAGAPSSRAPPGQL